MATISFNQIPADVGVPGSYVEFDGTGARTTTGGKKYVNLVFGQMSSSATKPANMPYLVSSATMAATYFGTGSILHHMAIAHFKTNAANETWLIGQTDDAAATARVVGISYAATYTSAAAVTGIERVYIDDAEYRVAVAVGDTATVIAAALAVVINADTTRLFEATAAAGVLTLTAKAKGELANDVQIVTQYRDTDVTPAGTFATAAQSTAGAQNPSIAASLASVASLDFTHVTMPYNDATNAALILAEAIDRWGAMPAATSLGQGQNDFQIFGAYRGSESQLESFMTARNSEYRTTLAVEPMQTISGVQYAGLMSSSFKAAAAYAALSSQLVSVVANKPHQNKVLMCLKAAPLATRFTFNTRRRAITNYGMATYAYNPDGNVMLEAAITERTLTDAGTATDAERRVETQFAKSYMRYSVRGMLESKFPAHRLADDGTAGLPSDVATPLLIKGAIISLAKADWVAKGIIEDIDNFIKTLVINRSINDCNTIEFQMFPNIVNILTVKAGKISYIVC